MHVHEAVAGDSDRYSGRRPQHNGAPAPTGNHGMRTTSVLTETTAYPELEEAKGDADRVGTQKPFFVMRFDTLASARAHFAI